LFRRFYMHYSCITVRFEALTRPPPEHDATLASSRDLRFRQINDNLFEAFIHVVDQYEQQVKLASETASTNAMTEASANLRAAAQVLDLFVDQLIADETPFVEVHTALSKLPRVLPITQVEYSLDLGLKRSSRVTCFRGSNLPERNLDGHLWE